MTIVELERTSSVSPIKWVDPETRRKFKESLLSTNVQGLIDEYRNLKELVEKPATPLEEARMIGTLEIQRLYLRMIGQMDAIEERSSIQPIKLIGDREVKILGRVYKNARTHFMSRSLSSRSPEEYTPEDVRMEARMNALTGILSNLDQDEYRKSIDMDVMFETMPKTGHGELH